MPEEGRAEPAGLDEIDAELARLSALLPDRDDNARVAVTDQIDSLLERRHALTTRGKEPR